MEEPMKSTKARSTMMWRLVQGLSATGFLVGILAVLAGLAVFLGPYNQLVDAFETASADVANIEDTLVQTSATLDQLVEILDTVSGSIDQIQMGVDDLDGLLDSVSEFLSGEAPDTIQSAHEALQSTQEGARAMDQVLRGLSTVSFLTGVEYEPEQSLDASLAEVAESLAPLPQSLRQVSGDLDQLKTNLDQLSETLVSLEADLPELQTELGRSSQTLQQNAESAGRLADTLAAAAERLRQARFLVGILSLFLALNFCAVQWVIWQVARQNTRSMDVDATQPTASGNSV
jgi:ABC-type transporter Mla subunit MlaD